jgi:hypothetical protein
MEFVRELREAAHNAPADLQRLLNRAAEELEMLRATSDDEYAVTSQAIKEAIRNERGACATVADQAGSPSIARAIRSRPSP